MAVTGIKSTNIGFAGCKAEKPGYILKIMKTTHAICQLNVLQAFGAQPTAVIAAVFFWWFGYGYFSQSPGRP
ncbi:hypothetical protein MLC70_02775 [Marinobacter goseongensis]|nr:hypothetical protein [Marinobacter goseongensis]